MGPVNSPSLLLPEAGEDDDDVGVIGRQGRVLLAPFTPSRVTSSFQHLGHDSPVTWAQHTSVYWKHTKGVQRLKGKLTNPEVSLMMLAGVVFKKYLPRV